MTTAAHDIDEPGARRDDQEAIGGGLLTILRAKMSTLRSGERKVANVIIERPDEIRQLSILDLAERSGVSEATVMRLCHALGCRGYSDFKIRMIEDLAVSHATGTRVAGEPYADVQEGDSIPVIIRKVLRMDIQALLDTMAVIDTAQIDAAVALLLNARHVECYGIGGSGPVVQDAAYRLLRVGVTANACTDSHLQVVHAALLGPQDVAFCISHSGETRDTVDTLLTARETGARTIALTSFPDSPLARAADLGILAAAAGSRWRGDNVAARIVQLSLIDALCVAIQLRQGDTYGEVIKKIEHGLARKQR